MDDLRILNGTVISDGAAVRRDISIAQGRIADVAEPGGLGAARQEIDADGCLVMPGAIDVHFHCRAPSHPERGDFASETRAAAAGGVTTVFEMPISDPACSTPQVLRDRRALGERDAFVNFALFAGGAVASVGDAHALAEAGAIAFKLFTTAPPEGRESEFVGLAAPHDDLVFDALTAIRQTGLTCTVHAENQPLISTLTRYGAGDEESHSPVVEASAVAVVAAIARETGARVHVAHVTSRAAVDVLRAAKARDGSALSAETCPHYLVLDRGSMARLGGVAKVAPPLRSVDDQAALWEALRDGVISIVASDHAPFLPHEKMVVDLGLAPNGIPSIEMLVPTVLDAAYRDVLSLEAAVELVTAAPARQFGLYPSKGSIQVGSDADIVIYDPRSTVRVAVERFHSRSAGSALAYDGMDVRGRVVRTIVEGQTVFHDGEIVARSGRFVSGHLSTTML